MTEQGLANDPDPSAIQRAFAKPTRNQRRWMTVLVLLVAGVASAADTPPPVPVVPKDAKTVVAFERPKPNPGVWTRIDRFNEQARAGGFDVMFLGDSITHGWESEHGKAVWDEKIAPFNAVNFGIGGDTTESVIWRLDNGNLAGAINPKVVVLMIGTNNTAAGDKPEEIAAGIGAILERLHKRFPAAKLLLYGIFPRHEPALRQNNEAVNKILATYEGHWNIKYVDIKPVFSKPDGAPLDGTTFDGLHPVAKGYEIWANSLVEELTVMLAAADKPGAGKSPSSRLWAQEPSLWDAARNYRLVRPLHPEFGWEGPRVTVYDPQIGKGGCNISNERLECSLWGTPDRLVFSMGKTDVFDRAHLNPFNGKKPVGQLLLLADEFAGAAQPQVATALRNGENTFRMQKERTSAAVSIALSDCESNVLAMNISCTALTKPLAIRVFRHNDTTGSMVPPQAGSDHGDFWIRQQFAADKTFPQGFDYVLMARVAGADSQIETVNGQPGLGAPVPFRNADAPGSAATARITAAAAHNLVVYATVVTRAEADDPIREAKRRLQVAEARGYAALLKDKEQWCRALFARREQGRIFTGNVDEIKDVILPYFYQGSFQSRHTFNSNPDPRRYESDAGYGVLESDRTAWCGLQCFNEELYTGDFVAGRGETISRYYANLFPMYRPVFEGYAKERGFNGLLVLRGYVPPVKLDRYWSPDAPADSRQACDWATLVWSFKNVWDEYDYGGQPIEFLREKVYPSLRGIADFFASLVKSGDDGYCHIEPSQIREEDMGRDAVDCVAAAKWAFRTATAAAQMLGVDAAKQEVWQSRLAKMAPYQVLRNERGEPVWASLVKDGKPVVAGHGTSHFIVNVADEVHLDSTEEEKQTAIRSNRVHYEQPMNRQVEMLLGKEPDTLCGTSVMANPMWLIHYADLFLRGTGESRSREARILQNPLLLKTRAEKAIACWMEPERLCNSRSGTIHFFPCVPGQFDVAFKDFQARGGFLVTGELRGGTVTYAKIKARRSGTCSVANPWPGKPAYVYELPGRFKVPTTSDGERIGFATVSGKEYGLTTVVLRSVGTPR